MKWVMLGTGRRYAKKGQREKEERGKRKMPATNRHADPSLTTE